MSEVLKESIVAPKAYSFALQVLRLIQKLKKTYSNIILINQIGRSATSIGANIEEALGSNTRRDFSHCMTIAKKEARETSYWLRLIKETNQDQEAGITDLMEQNNQLIRILTSIVKTSSKVL